jgi:hypothetical protein
VRLDDPSVRGVVVDDQHAEPPQLVGAYPHRQVSVCARTNELARRARRAGERFKHPPQSVGGKADAGIADFEAYVDSDVLSVGPR